MIQDKLIEKERYNHIAKIILEQNPTQFGKPGSYAIPLVFRSPYLFYEEKINELIKPDNNVLEIGSGGGLNTYSLIKTGANVTATDISRNSLDVLEYRLSTVEGGGVG